MNRVQANLHRLVMRISRDNSVVLTSSITASNFGDKLVIKNGAVTILTMTLQGDVESYLLVEPIEVRTAQSVLRYFNTNYGVVYNTKTKVSYIELEGELIETN